jgi:hypothetical protein
MWVPVFPPAIFPFFLLPTFFGTCGQLLLVGSGTCPPCPGFFQNFHFSITFDPLVQKLQKLYSRKAYAEAHVLNKFHFFLMNMTSNDTAQTPNCPYGGQGLLGVIMHGTF